MANPRSIRRYERVLLATLLLLSALAPLSSGPSARAAADGWAEDGCYYEDDVQLGCLVSVASGLYFYENATAVWFLVEDSAGDAECEDAPNGFTCEELTERADAQWGYWGADDCFYDADGVQLGCLQTDGKRLYYHEIATDAWYVVEVEADGSWSLTKLSSVAGFDEMQTAQAMTAERFITAKVDELNEYWEEVFEGSGMEYRESEVVLANEPVTSQCMTEPVDEMEDWVFYCSTDQAIFFAPGTLRVIARFGIDVLLFYVGHEVGHHVQYWADPEGNDAGYRANPVPYELQANCLSGVWFAYLDNLGELDEDAVDAVIEFLESGTDDGVHGTPEQQADYFVEGYETGEC